MKKASEFAAKAHGTQTYGDKPYTHHLEMVIEVLYRFGFSKDRDLLQAAYLHDTIEDTDIRWFDLWACFNKGVADLVEAVTDGPGKNRKERHASTYPYIRQFGARAVALKLADRIANVEHSIATSNTGKFKMYRKEHKDFEKVLRIPSEHVAMWLHLKMLLEQS
jgi:(p)ppGpp synthase/HD superfamily hydrolase